MTMPKLLPQLRMIIEKCMTSNAFEHLYYACRRVCRRCGQEKMNMVGHYFHLLDFPVSRLCNCLDSRPDSRLCRHWKIASVLRAPYNVVCHFVHCGCVPPYLHNG